MTEQRTYALHEHCDAGRDRAKLFTFFAQSIGYSIIPGRYGGELNNDMLALGEKYGHTVLVLGLKAVEPGGAIRIDTMSLGPYKQMSPAWLDVLVFSLGLSEETIHFADAISFARDSGTLALELVFVEPATSIFSTVKVAYNGDA